MHAQPTKFKNMFYNMLQKLIIYCYFGLNFKNNSYESQRLLYSFTYEYTVTL
ncbi:hypothetical protein [uncultured Mediterranean phage]|nr:hypothetical protein [uncultured Mediterranean phage]